MSPSEKDLKNGIVSKLQVRDPEYIQLYWKGRVGLYSLLKASGLQEGDEVVIPAFTCVVVPNAVIYAGGTPVYVDIGKDTLTPSFESICSVVTERTKVILCQNTFGLSTDVDRIAEFCWERGILCIEDCAHGFGGTYRGRPNGTWCDAAFFSTQWNKPFSTGLGGFSYVKSDPLLEKLKEEDSKLLTPSWRERWLLHCLIKLRKHFLRPWNYWPLLRTYRIMSRMGWVLGSSSSEEIMGTSLPRGYFKGMSSVQVREGVDVLKKLDDALQVRKRMAEHYTKVLKEWGKWHVLSDLFDDHAFLTYPILVKDRELFRRKAEKAKIPLGDWFSSPLHPIQGELTQWGLDRKEFPVADQISSQILNLPTEPKDPDKVMDFLERSRSLLCSEEELFPGTSRGLTF